MQNIIIKPKNKKEFDLLNELLKKMQVQTKILNEEKIENLGLVELLKEVDRTQKVSKSKIMSKLTK